MFVYNLNNYLRVEESISSLLSFQIEDELQQQLDACIPKRYYEETGVQKAMDAIQKEFECCGVTNLTDWGKQAKKQEVPKSCCKPPTATTITACVERKYIEASTRFSRQYYEKVGAEHFTLREKCPNAEFCCSVFPRIWTEYGPEKTPYLDTFKTVSLLLI